ncbi:protein of unknown function [Taphrina deformans PYCC 5710]|uniref:Glycosyltransferase family 31 protein n=1 Tax=Taphrina deformans (strain PYCC 5710 / ATCC 11124 / CBS 356.35 / IMI 108563 / JCM 9778 / NBRC 8474) TaxID=1097556 RepID=R4XKH7_TAPDE|nr:protein of unknown function [Taphrina deformans PYCC 5710]|eukprot:CCG83824.1 protein of unknown function [Taphrina deformans PYCC 5710]
MKPALANKWHPPRHFRHPAKTLCLLLGLAYLLYLLIVPATDEARNASRAKSEAPATTAAQHAVDQVDLRLHEKTPLDTKVIDQICRVEQNSDDVHYKVVLKTEAVPPSARRQLYGGFPSFQYAPTTTDTLKAAAYSAAAALSTENSVLASGCTVYTNVIFGVASSKDRLLVPHAVTSHWLGNSSTNLYVHVPAKDVPDAEAVIIDHYKNFGLAHAFVGRESLEVDQTMQYARLSAAMYELTVKNDMKDVLWYVHLDDDTLLTSITDYLRMLDTYDASLPLYVGAHSESISAVARDGRGAWGGASIAISRVLARQLSERWLECTSEGRLDHTEFGDHKLDACVAYIQGRTRKQPDMQLENTLHQLDFFGSVDGVLRSGVKWLTLHHFAWVNLFPYPDGPGGTPAKVQKIVNSARILGSDGLFSNFVLKHDESGATILTNGYAVTRYMVPMTKLELESVERTYMQDKPDDFESALGPTRLPKAEGTEKRTYFVHQVVPRVVKGKTIGSTWTYRYDRDGIKEDIIVDWLL